MALDDELKQVGGMMGRTERISKLKLVKVLFSNLFTEEMEGELSALEEQHKVDMSVLRKMAYS